MIFEYITLQVRVENFAAYLRLGLSWKFISQFYYFKNFLILFNFDRLLLDLRDYVSLTGFKHFWEIASSLKINEALRPSI